MGEEKKEIVLDFRLVGPEAQAKILKELDILIDTKVREILMADETYCKARGWEIGTA